MFVLPHPLQISMYTGCSFVRNFGLDIRTCKNFPPFSSHLTMQTLHLFIRSYCHSAIYSVIVEYLITEVNKLVFLSRLPQPFVYPYLPTATPTPLSIPALVSPHHASQLVASTNG